MTPYFFDAERIVIRGVNERLEVRPVLFHKGAEDHLNSIQEHQNLFEVKYKTELEKQQELFEQSQQLLENKIKQNDEENKVIIENFDKKLQQLKQSQMSSSQTEQELFDRLIKIEHEKQNSHLEQRFKIQQELFDEKQKLMEAILAENKEKYKNLEEKLQQIKLNQIYLIQQILPINLYKLGFGFLVFRIS
ncbi:unnamed protein product [Didymodactylos carnosus]|uniref:Uncharacterized protein n=2 Tax=Didymodactylos carnosus TaxID=1234261 RepID=A0A814IDH8_9BILA|nr:unnamed protein product [Didymodactylos carnosus]CAF3791678.1 unnamed protein product [Didymodactylos carnosus]